MYDASEALRLAASFVASTSHATGPPAQGLPTCHTGSPGFGWQVRGSYLVCLLHTGELWEMLGSSSDALHALQEGHELVSVLPFAHQWSKSVPNATELPRACVQASAFGSSVQHAIVSA